MHCPSVGTKFSNRADTETLRNSVLYSVLWTGPLFASFSAAASPEFSL